MDLPSLLRALISDVDEFAMECFVLVYRLRDVDVMQLSVVHLNLGTCS
jgi:hypothetical protein